MQVLRALETASESSESQMGFDLGRYDWSIGKESLDL